jgi:CDP-ribitol ribitolphosphotransferase
MRVLTVPAIWLAQALYALMKLLPRRHKVVMLSRQSNRPSIDFTMLSEELTRTDPSLEVVVRCRFIEPGLGARIAYVGEVLAQMYHLATASACVVDGYIVPVSVLTHSDGLRIVQMWHALGAIKKFGLQAVGLPGGRDSSVADAMKMHRNYDVVICGGPASVPAFAEAFGSDPSRVVPLGLPRADYLLDGAGDAAEQLRERFPLLADRSRTTVLYAPTYRRNRPDRYDDVLQRFDDPRYALVIKPHPLVESTVTGENVVNASDVDVLDLLPLCDAVITDYSAVAFEAAVLDKPIYFFLYDFEEYEREHGLNVDLFAEMPGATYRDLGPIAERIDTGVYDPELVRRLAERYVSVRDGSCTRQIAAVVLGSESGGAA